MSRKNLALDVESIALYLSEEGGYEYYHIDDDLKELKKDVSDMQAENAKLRELVTDMWFWSYCGYIDNEPEEVQMNHIDSVVDRMRKLGVVL